MWGEKSNLAPLFSDNHPRRRTSALGSGVTGGGAGPADRVRGCARARTARDRDSASTRLPGLGLRPRPSRSMDPVSSGGHRTPASVACPVPRPSSAKDLELLLREARVLALKVDGIHLGPPHRAREAQRARSVGASYRRGAGGGTHSGHSRRFSRRPESASCWDSGTTSMSDRRYGGLNRPVGRSRFSETRRARQPRGRTPWRRRAKPERPGSAAAAEATPSRRPARRREIRRDGQ